MAHSARPITGVPEEAAHRMLWWVESLILPREGEVQGKEFMECRADLLQVQAAALVDMVAGIIL